MHTSRAVLFAALVAISEIAVAQENIRSAGYLALPVTTNRRPKTINRRDSNPIELELNNQNFFYTTEGEFAIFAAATFARNPGKANKPQWASDRRHRR